MAALGTDALQVEQVRIPSGGVSIAGDLYTPSGPHPEGGRPALVVGHGFSFVREALVEQASLARRPTGTAPSGWPGGARTRR